MKSQLVITLWPRSRASRVLAILFALGANAFAADGPSAAELKLRESLRASMLELRTAQTERANLQTANADLEAKNAALAAQLEELRAKGEKEKKESAQQLDELERKVAERDREIGSLRVTLDKWKVGHAKIIEIAQTTEGRRAKLADKVVQLERVVADQRTKNAAIHKLGLEILARYEKFGLGLALTAREPFVGLTRVKFQNLIQDYGDKLEDERIKPEASPSSPTNRSTPAAR